MSDGKSVFETLNAIDCSKYVEEKNKLSYLTWTYAWQETVKKYPDATYKIIKQDNGLPYVFDEKTGYMVYTTVTIGSLTHEMWLLVMDGANKAMKDKPYTYKGYKWENGNKVEIEKTVEAATMFDINKTIMRCLVKNLAMFGLGLYIYAGEDLPEEVKQENIKKEKLKNELDSISEEVKQEVKRVAEEHAYLGTQQYREYFKKQESAIRIYLNTMKDEIKKLCDEADKRIQEEEDKAIRGE